jgi:fluoroquinolone resistance protein
MEIIEDIVFEKIDFRTEALKKGEYENCSFKKCILADCDLNTFKFIGCIFENCDLSLANINKVVLRDVQFKDCKMIGLKFDTTDSFSISIAIENCILTYASFYKLKLKNTIFIHSKLNEVDFTEADLTNAIFDHCDLTNSIFSATNLEKADLTTAFNYSIDMDANKIKKSKHSKGQLGGLLEKYNLIIE